VKDETRALLESAARHLDYARRTLQEETAPVAAREAYLAAYHAAHALVFEAAGAVIKTLRDCVRDSQS
jgi:HEPN domain-containing protein